MDLIQQYIFLSASEIKESKGVNKRLIKEASGGKIFNKLEIVARMIFLKPSLALSAIDEPNKNTRGVESSARTLVLLLLKRLQEPDIHTSTIGKVKECLNILVIGLSHNTTVEAWEILPFFICQCLLLFLEANQLRSIKTRKNMMTVKLRKSSYKNQQDVTKLG